MSENVGGGAPLQGDEKPPASAGASIDMDEDPEAELLEEDMEEVHFDNDLPPSDDEDDGDMAEMDEGLDEEDALAEEGKRGKKLPLVPDRTETTFSGHSDSVYCVAMNRDQTKAVSGGGDDDGYLWEVATGNTIAKLGGHSDSLIDCGFSFDDTLVATAAYDATVKVWSAETGALLRSLEGPSSEVEFLQWHSKGNVIMAGSQDATCWIWDANSGNCLSVLAGHEAALTCGQFSPNGKRAITGSLDGSVRMWDPKTSTCVHNFTGHEWHQAGVVSLACSSLTPILVAGGQDGTARIASMETKRVIASFNHDHDKDQNNAQVELSSVETVAFCDVMPFLATGGTDGTLKIFDLNTQACRQICKHEDTVVKVHFVPQSPLVVSASSDGTCKLWDSRSASESAVLTSHSDMILDLAVANNIIITCADDHACRVAKLPTQ